MGSDALTPSRDKKGMDLVDEINWKLFAPLSIEGSTLLIENQDLPDGMAVRLGGVGGVILRPQEAQELLLNLLTGESWVNSRLVWASPRLHIGQRGFTLNERAKLALIETLQSLLVESQGTNTSPAPKQSWQRAMLELSQTTFSSIDEALPKVSDMLTALGLSGVSLWLREEGQTHGFMQTASYPSEPTGQQLTAESYPVYFEVLSRNIIIPIEDVRQDARMTELRNFILERGIGGLLQVVIHGQSGMHGILWIESQSTRDWTQSEETLGIALGQIFERILRPTKEEIRVAPSEQKGLLVRRPEFDNSLNQAISLAQRHSRLISLIRIKIEGITRSQIEQAAREIAGSLRQSDSLTYLGEPGFAVLLTEVREDGSVSRVANRVYARLGAILPGMKIAVGVADFPAAGSSPEALWKHAEDSTSLALETGGGIRMLTPRATELQEAISNDGLTLHFQPVFDLGKLDLVSVEALSRWPQHRKTESAGDFVSLAEKSGLLGAQDRWALEKVLDQVAIWRPSGVGAVFSANISNETLYDHNFPMQLQEMLVMRDLSPEVLALEIREDSIMADLETASRGLEILKHLGVQIALDNFGSSPLPLTQLKKLPLDWIKLSPMLSTVENSSLAKASIAMVHAVGAKAVAKGLEEQAQLNRMRDLGADYGQGHILGWPVPAEDLGALLVWGIQ